MMKNFTIEEAGATFQFITMNRRMLQLFQVYVIADGLQARFHMQINEGSGDFRITEKSQCPAQYHQAEKLLSDAIKIYGKADKIPT